MSYLIKVMILTLLAISIGGCSTFEVRKGHLIERNDDFVYGRYKEISNYSTLPQTSPFYFIGMIGLPIIPVAMSLYDNQKIRILINFNPEYNGSPNRKEVKNYLVRPYLCLMANNKKLCLIPLLQFCRSPLSSKRDYRIQNWQYQSEPDDCFWN